MSTETTNGTSGKSRTSPPKKPLTNKKKTRGKKGPHVKKKVIVKRRIDTAAHGSVAIASASHSYARDVPDRFLRVLDVGTFTAGEIGTQTGKVLDTVLEQGVISIAKYGDVKFVLLTKREYNKLLGRDDKSSINLGDLEEQFDQLYADMQKPGANDVFTKLLDATPEQLTRAARKSVAERG